MSQNSFTWTLLDVNVSVSARSQRPFSGEPQSGASVSHMGRNPPHSAVGEANSRLITFINGNAVFKSNFQQQKEGIWKGATRREKPWLVAGNAQRSSEIYHVFHFFCSFQYLLWSFTDFCNVTICRKIINSLQS